MLEILPISGEYLFVIAEDIVDFSQSAIVLRSDTAQPGFFGAKVERGKGKGKTIESDHCGESDFRH